MDPHRIDFTQCLNELTGRITPRAYLIQSSTILNFFVDVYQSAWVKILHHPALPPGVKRGSVPDPNSTGERYESLWAVHALRGIIVTLTHFNGHLDN